MSFSLGKVLPLLPGVPFYKGCNVVVAQWIVVSCAFKTYFRPTNNICK